MRQVETVKTAEQRQPVEAHLAAQDLTYRDIWKVGGNTVLWISYLLSLTMDDARGLDREQPTLNIIESKTGKHRKIIVNQIALAILQQRLADNPDHLWLFQSVAANRNRCEPPNPSNRESVIGNRYQGCLRRWGKRSRQRLSWVRIRCGKRAAVPCTKPSAPSRVSPKC